MSLGDLEPHTAILLPVIYQQDENAAKIGIDNYKQMAYDVRTAGDSTAQIITIPSAAATSWTPLLNDPAGVGRASVDDDRDRRIDDVLPK
jgi:hypothetical protein